MKFIVYLLQVAFSLLLATLLFLPIFYLFCSILTASHFIIPYAIYPFDICLKAPKVWYYMKLLYCLTLFYVCFIFSNFVFCKFIKNKIKFKSKRCIRKINQQNGIALLLGKDLAKNNVYLSEASLFQNILITGTIGTGKTSSGMYPFTKQLIQYMADSNNKIGMLILDVKGNFYKQVLNFAQECDRLDDLYVIEVGGNVKYNPLDKPNIKPSVLANRLKTILTLFSPNNSESYWLDEAEKVLTECIKLCRLYNDGYVTFTEIHKLVNSPNYYNEKVEVLRNLFKSREIKYFSNFRSSLCPNIF